MHAEEIEESPQPGCQRYNTGLVIPACFVHLVEALIWYLVRLRKLVSLNCAYLPIVSYEKTNQGLVKGNVSG